MFIALGVILTLFVPAALIGTHFANSGSPLRVVTYTATRRSRLTALRRMLAGRR